MTSKYNAQRLNGKVAIVTAATNGIGLAIAERLGHEGAQVVISSRNEENVNKAVKQLVDSGLKPENVHGCVCHVGNADHRQRLVNTTLEKFARIDILVNNAGISPTAGDIMETSEEAWDKLFDVNVKAGFLLTKLVVPHMQKNGGGNVVFNSSVTAYNCPPIIAAYGVTKTALLGLTKAMAESLAPKNIRVNCIAPGIIKTKFSRPLWEGVKATEIHQHQRADLQPPLGRFGTPEECAGVVAFLCSTDASYVTGESIVIGGGAHARL
ncbi:enoyl-(Acyl carrier protein) reductase domain-containing protein [Ditylenchus destructor]|nr:enoyl-(Acyl carrier protein) reductase domain-containing protein [Ditylenchus destructor]